MEKPQSEAPRPVFIHGFWRTGSTYIWKKFRDQKRYRAYWEPFNEHFVMSHAELSRMYSEEFMRNIRHPDGIGSYLDEYPFAPGGGVEYYAKSFAYQSYCLDEGAQAADLERYVANLIDHARRNHQVPVLQFNRSLLRVGWLTSHFRPVNILLLRRPIDVWQSYVSFSGLYFPTMLSLIVGQNRANHPLNSIAEFQTIPSFVNGHFENDFQYYSDFTRRNLASLYPVFYSFYLLTCVSAAPYADCIIDMNEVSTNPQAREAVTGRLRQLGAQISLSDCNVPRHTALAPADRQWLAYESVARKLLRRRLPSSLLLPPGKLAQHQLELGDYFRGALAEFELQPRGENPMPDRVVTLASDERYRQATLLAEQGQYGEALPLIEEALGEEETGERWSDWGAVQRALGNRENAERGFRKALELDPKLATAATNLGVLLFEAGKLEEAAPFLKQAHQSANGEAAALSKLVEQCEAARVAPPVTEAERALVDAHRRFGAVLADLRGMAHGLVARFPGNLEAHLLLGEILQAGGQADLALAEYDKVRQNAPANQRRRIDQAIQQCRSDRDYFPPEFAKRMESGEYADGINAPAWRSYRDREIQRSREIVRLLRERIPLAGRRVLDVGCGYGGTLIAFAEQGSKVVGVEIAEERARTGKKRLADLGIEVDYRLDDICVEGIEDRLGTFDVIVAQDVLEHVADPALTIRTLSSLLRPGGVIYAQVGNKYSPDQLLADHHYGRAGITLLARAQAIDYYCVATGIHPYHYGVGFWRTERYYRRMFARFGVELELADKFPNRSYVDFYSTFMEQVRRRAETEIYPGLRPELQQRMQRRMTTVARYFNQVRSLLPQCESNPELSAKISDRLVKRICVPVWRFLGTKAASVPVSNRPYESTTKAPPAISAAASPASAPSSTAGVAKKTSQVHAGPDQSLPGAEPGTEKPVLAYYGHHKCGSDWIHRVIKDVAEIAGLSVYRTHYSRAFEGEILDYRRQHPFDFLSFTNANYVFIRSLPTLGFHVVRDPRDLIVSAYFSHLNSHPDENWPELRLWRRYLRSISKEEGLMGEIEYMGWVFHKLLMWKYGERPSILEFRFEDMIRDPLSMFTQAFEHMGIMPAQVSREALPPIIEKNSFQNLSGGRAPGSEDALHHYRRGVAGDWRNHFTREHIAYFKTLYNPLLLRLGYEHSSDWH